MKPAILSMLLMTSAAATAAFGQEGAGQGPPNAVVIVVPIPTSLPAGTASTLPAPPK
jgi:hypothetical protein